MKTRLIACALILKLGAFLVAFVFAILPAHAQSSATSKLAIQLLLNLDGGSRNTADGAVVVFNNRFSAGIGNEDSYKFTNVDENLAILRNGINLSIEGRPSVASYDTLPLKIWQFRQKLYSLKLDATNFTNSVTATVRDKYLNMDIPVNLLGTTIIPIAITSDSLSFASNRFSVVFKTSSLLPVFLSDVKGYQKGNGVEVNWTSRGETGMSAYVVERSADGINFIKVAELPAKNVSTPMNYSWYDANVLAGLNFYRIKVIEQSGEARFTSIIKVNLLKGNSGLVVFPNPVVSSTLSLQFTNLDKGDYALYLFNTMGQIVYSRLLKHGGGSATQALAFNRQLEKGIYKLQLTNGVSVYRNNVVF